MRERPILFSAPMVRAILAGTKTQTRRVIKPSWSRCLDLDFDDDRERARVGCPYGAPGDRLWVRETHAQFTVGEGMDRSVPQCVAYRATCDDDGGFDYVNGRSEIMRLKVTRWTPAIHMPRWASRILLEVVSVRVERLQSISMVDAIAEGAQRFADIPGTGARWSMEQPTHTDQCLGSPQMAFANLYNKIHAGENWNLKPGPSPWDANPWVWAVEFKRIDQQAKEAA